MCMHAGPLPAEDEPRRLHRRHHQHPGPQQGALVSCPALLSSAALPSTACRRRVSPFNGVHVVSASRPCQCCCLACPPHPQQQPGAACMHACAADVAACCLNRCPLARRFSSPTPPASSPTALRPPRSSSRASATRPAPCPSRPRASASSPRVRAHLPARAASLPDPYFWLMPPARSSCMHVVLHKQIFISPASWRCMHAPLGTVLCHVDMHALSCILSHAGLLPHCAGLCCE
jgi:hypothetical protein